MPRSASICSCTTWSIPMASLTLLSELMNYDFSGLALDAPITDELIGRSRASAGWSRTSSTHIGGDTVTLGDLAGHRATLLQGPRFVGTGPEVADQMEEWFDADACDGFVIAATHSRAPTRTWSGWWCPSSSGAACSGTVTPGHAARAPRAGPPRVSARCLNGRGPLHGLRVVDAATLAAGPLVATAMGEFGAEVIKVEQPGPGIRCAPGATARTAIGLVWKSVSRNKRCVTLDLRRPRDRSSSTAARRQRRAGRQQPPERAGPLGPRLRVGPPRPSAARHAARQRLRRAGPASDRPGFGTLAEAMSGFAHVTGQPDGPPTLPPFMLADGVAAQAATYAVMMALYHRDVHGGGGPAGRRQPHRAAGPPHRVLHPGLRPARHRPRPGGQPARRQRPPQRLPDGRRQWVAISSASPNIVMRGSTGPSTGPTWPRPRLRRPVRRQARRSRSTRWWPSGSRSADPGRGDGRLRGGRGGGRPIYDAEQLLADEHLRARGTFVRGRRPRPRPGDGPGPGGRLSETPGRIDPPGPGPRRRQRRCLRWAARRRPDRSQALRAAGVI
jgi:hypothetical protein